VTNFTRNFLAHARVTDDPAGDLIKDMRRDKTLPPLFGSIKEMREYLHRRGACLGALEAVPVVWRRYSTWLARNPTRS
jgi:hypothetical protein